ncbi:Fur family transcriptional regulator [Chloroflexota bacterium]
MSCIATLREQGMKLTPQRMSILEIIHNSSEHLTASELGVRFVHHQSEEGHHNHLVCMVCDRNIYCYEDVFLPVEAALDEKHDFEVDFNHIVISGLSNNCRNRSY